MPNENSLVKVSALQAVLKLYSICSYPYNQNIYKSEKMFIEKPTPGYELSWKAVNFLQILNVFYIEPVSFLLSHSYKNKK